MFSLVWVVKQRVSRYVRLLAGEESGRRLLQMQGGQSFRRGCTSYWIRL